MHTLAAFLSDSSYARLIRFAKRNPFASFASHRNSKTSTKLSTLGRMEMETSATISSPLRLKFLPCSFHIQCGVIIETFRCHVRSCSVSFRSPSYHPISHFSNVYLIVKRLAIVCALLYVRKHVQNPKTNVICLCVAFSFDTRFCVYKTKTSTDI